MRCWRLGRRCGRRDGWYAGELLRVVEGMLHRTVGPVARGDAAVNAIRALVDSVDRGRALSAVDRSAVRTRLLKLLPPVDSGTVDTSVIVPGDGWATKCCHTWPL